jgi:hypothetical protein
MEKSAKLDIFSQLNYQEVKMLQSETSKPSIPSGGVTTNPWNAAHGGTNTVLKYCAALLQYSSRAPWMFINAPEVNFCG